VRRVFLWTNNLQSSGLSLGFFTAQFSLILALVVDQYVLVF
jgi:hypothetical protein